MTLVVEGDEVVTGVVVTVGWETVVLVVERDDKVNIEDRILFFFFVGVCVEVITVIVLVEEGRVDWVVGVYVVVKWLSVVLIEVVVEVFVDVVLVECGNLVSIEVIRRGDVVVGVAKLVEKAIDLVNGIVKVVIDAVEVDEG